MGSAPSYEAPDYGQANREAIVASAETLPIIQKLNNAAQLGTQAVLSQQELATLGKNASDYTPTDGGYVYADFTGQGADVLANQQAQAYINAIQQTTPELLSIQQQYGTDFAQAAREANAAANPEQFAAMQRQAQELEGNNFATVNYTEDPTERALRDKLTQSYASDVALGGQLSPEQQALVEQSARRAQVARGNVYGNAPSVEEALKTLDYSTQLDAARKAGAQSWLSSGQTGTAYDLTARTAAANQQNQSYANYLNALQNFQTSTPTTTSSVQSSTAGSGASQQTIDPSNIASTAASIYGTQGNIYSNQMANTVSPWAAALGAGTSLGSAYLLGRG